jgi:hypothetical protein
MTGKSPAGQVIRLKDLVPRENVKGGRKLKTVFGLLSQARKQDGGKPQAQGEKQ